ncbi:unnamed protein product [Brachionus calyciflorus]|uniref:Uncharacterized protein n=1 Tax=Brachionus calyciflorus TaxID=104777 RepID=A0A814FZ55_9BILA|nr:unnamed protein product [Brachionus calyciflorus]
MKVVAILFLGLVVSTIATPISKAKREAYGSGNNQQQYSAPVAAPAPVQQEQYSAPVAAPAPVQQEQHAAYAPQSSSNY